MLERDAGNHSLARELFKCAVKADPKSEPSWLVSAAARADVPPCHGLRRRLCRCLHGGWARLDGACLRALREGLNKACPAPPPPPAQVWAQMEEDLGFYQRAMELRSYSMQARAARAGPGCRTGPGCCRRGQHARPTVAWLPSLH